MLHSGSLQLRGRARGSSWWTHAAIALATAVGLTFLDIAPVQATGTGQGAPSAERPCGQVV